MLAGLRPEKRVDVFVEAVARVPGLRGVVAGEGRERARLERLIAELRADVELLGERHDTAELIRGRDGGLPAQRGRGAADVDPRGDGGRAGRWWPRRWAACTDAVADGETGVLVAPGDADALAGALAGAGQDAARMGAAGRRRLEERFTLEAMVHGYEKALGL